MDIWAQGQSSADSDQFVAGPARARLAISTGVLSNVRVLGQALVVSQNLIQGTATGGGGIQDLVQKSEEGEFGGKDAFAAVVAGFIGLEQQWFEALGAKAFQVMKGTPAQSQAGGVEWGVEFAKKRGGGKHLYVSILIY